MLRLRPAYAAVPLFIAALLTGCGGGGGGGSSGGGTTTPAATPALAFTPASITASAVAGTSLTINVMAAVARPGDFAGATVFASVTDSNNVILPSSTVVRDSDSQYHAVLLTSPTLAAGNYKGSLSVRLCRDSACASQFPGAPVALPYDLTVIPAGSATFSAVPAMPLSVSAQPGSPAPAPVAVAITATGRSWTATSSASWAKPSAASGTGDGTVNLSFDASGLAQGVYSATLSIQSNDGVKIDLPLSLTVLPPGLVLGSNSITFNAINGAPIPTQIVSLDTDTKLSAGWSASSDAAWLSVSPTAGTTPATTVLTVNPGVGPLASGSYTGHITIVPSGLATRTLPVTLNLTKATLATLPSTLPPLGGDYGRDFSSGVDLKLSLNTGALSWPWQLNGMPSWATATATAGSVNAAGTSVTLKAKPANAPVGNTPVLLSAIAAVQGDAVGNAVLLSINKDQHKLLPAENAVAFVSMPGWSRLTRTISVVDNYVAADKSGKTSFGGMSASSDQPWLVVGVSADKLILTADPSQLLSDTLNTATITITATDPDASAPEVIRVALWKGSAAPAAASKASLPYTNVVADPLRPYAYLHNGGAVIDVYNVYTGQKEASITGFSAHLGDMAVTPNGDSLYVVDVDNARVTTVDLNMRAISQQLPLSSPGTKATRIKVLHPNGVEMLLLSDGQLFQTATRTRLGVLPLSTGGTLAASGDGKRVTQQDEGNGTVTHTSVSVDYAAMGGGTLFAARLAPASHTSPGSLGGDVWVSADGKRVYSAAATPKSCVIMNSPDLGIIGYMTIGDAAPNNIEVALDGRIFCGGAARAGSNDIYMYDSTGTKVLQQYKLSTTGKQLLPRQMVVSGDGWMIVAITDDNVVTFLPIGP